MTGRPKGSKDTKPRKMPEKPPVLPEPPTSPPSEQPEGVGGGTLADIAQGILSDPEYRKSLKTRALAGRLTPMESRWLFQQGQAPVEKKTEPWEKLIAEATPEELDTIAFALRRSLAVKTPKSGRKVGRSRRAKAKQVLTKQVLSSPEGVVADVKV